MAPGVMVSRKVARGTELVTDPTAEPWRGAHVVVADRSPLGEPVDRHRTEIRSVWSPDDLYFHFVCPYDRLHLNPHPSLTQETNQLWMFDVAEVFLGSDFQHIRRYKEFQVSPQAEWVDLDIDRDAPNPADGWRWTSGMTVSARIDAPNRVWYGAMKIPFAALIGGRAPAAGLELRANLYRLQGPPSDRVYIAWQPTGALNYHVPEAFGRLRLG